MSLIHSLITPVAARTGIRFSHGLVGDARRVALLRRSHPELFFVALSKSRDEPLPQPDYALLASLESPGVPTIRSMVQGDRVLRERDESESLGYATLLARRLKKVFEEHRPDVVLASFDSLHSGMALAVSKSLGIPWVALAFTVIPADLTGFCRGMTPDTLVPLTRAPDEELRRQARKVIADVRARRQHVVAYRPPVSLRQRMQQLVAYGTNLVRRIVSTTDLGVDRFTYPTAWERSRDILRRTVNDLLLPSRRMLTTPPAARFVFFPLQMTPESSIDTWAPAFQNQLTLVAQLSLAMPVDVEFVVKLHFSDHDNYARHRLLELMQLPRLHIAHPRAPSLPFLQQAALVVTIQGTASLEAALLGKPVLLFGDSPYQNFPRTQRARRADQLQEQIRSMLELPPPHEDEIEAAFAAYIARYLPGRINDWTRAIAPEEIAPLAECFQALRAHVATPANRLNWYNEPPFVGPSESQLP